MVGARGFMVRLVRGRCVMYGRVAGESEVAVCFPHTIRPSFLPR